MKVINGKAKYEIVTCSFCEGKGETSRYIFCPQDEPSTRIKGIRVSKKHPCVHCGTTVGYQHKAIGERNVKCPYCDGKGKAVEDRCSGDIEHIVATLPMTVVQTTQGLTFTEEYLGGGSVTGCMDYGRHKFLTDEQLIAQIREGLKGGFTQYAHFVNKDNAVAKELLLIRKSDGYTVYPKY